MPLSISDPFYANENPIENQYAPFVVGLKGGDFAVFWQPLKLDGSSYEIVGRIFDKTGIPKSAESKINQKPEGTQRWVTACKLKNNDVAVGWMTSESGSLPIKLRVMSADLSSGSEELKIVSSHSGHFHPKIALLSSGDFVASWVDYYSKDYPSVKTRVFDRSGKSISQQLSVDKQADHLLSHSAISNVAGNKFVVVWRSSFNGQDTDIKAQVFNRRLLPQSPHHYVAKNIGYHSIEGLPDAHSSLNAIAKLRDDVFVTAYATSSGVDARIMSFGGSVLREDHHIQDAATANQVTSVSVSADVKGNFLIAWSSDKGVQGRIFDKVGAKLSDEFEIGEQSNSNCRRCNISYQGQNFVAVWETSSNNSPNAAVKGRTITWID